MVLQFASFRHRLACSNTARANHSPKQQGPFRSPGYFLYVRFATRKSAKHQIVFSDFTPSFSRFQGCDWLTGEANGRTKVDCNTVVQARTVVRSREGDWKREMRQNGNDRNRVFADKRCSNDCYDTTYVHKAHL